MPKRPHWGISFLAPRMGCCHGLAYASEGANNPCRAEPTASATIVWSSLDYGSLLMADAPARAPDILVIEDDPDLCTLVSLALGGLGTVDTANSVAAARAAVVRRAPDLVVLDVLLPDGNGLELVTEFQRDQPIHVPILILTGLGSGDEKVRGFNAGADDYLLKPFDLDELRARVRALLRMRQVEQTLAARNRSLEQANRAASILLDMAHALTELGDQATVLQGALKLLPRLFQADRAAIWLTTPDQGLERIWGLEVKGSRPPRRISDRLHPHYAALPVDERGLLVVEDIRLSGLPTAAINEGEQRSLILATIMRGQERLGALLIGYEAPRQFDTQTRDVVQGLASQLAIAIENARLFERLREAALTDSSTGLRNMRFFQGALAAELSRSQRRQRDHGVIEPLSVLMMDLNQFKQYNDSYGHPVGDEALRRFGELVQSRLRQYDTLARYGGDEFIALLPATSADAARRLAKRLRQHVTNSAVQLGDGINVRFSCSFGVATYPVNGTSANELIRMADDALYAAKRNAGDVRTASASVPGSVPPLP
jgi:two-component system, cell cycle response regulator